MKVLYFTGTGNSKYAAERIAEIAGATVTDLRPLIKADLDLEINDEDIVVAMPVYAWRMPEILENWLRRQDFNKAKRIWYVMTCGDESGSANSYNAVLSKDLGLEHMGTAEIIMPENYIAMFNAPFEEESKEIVAAAEDSIQEAGAAVRDGKKFKPIRVPLKFSFMSAIGNKAFFRLFVKADAFEAGEGCIGCGKCAELCPMNNIALVDGKPSWGKACTHCMACICYCPTEAIEYGENSKGKFRYNFERLGIK